MRGLKQPPTTLSRNWREMNIMLLLFFVYPLYHFFGEEILIVFFTIIGAAVFVEISEITRHLENISEKLKNNIGQI